MLDWLVALCQLGLAGLMAMASLIFLRSAFRAWGWPLGGVGPVALPDALPAITVQLPLRNERAVAERVMRAAVALDWPRDRIEVQVLDDSDDETRAIVDRVAAELAAEGHAISVVRRAGRAGYKAGALAHALPLSRGDLLLVLDADSVPEPDLVRRLAAPLLADGALAFSQARWRFDNEPRSLLTRTQALILHGLFVVEQPLLARARLPVQFNGTAGMWKRSALLAAGGWVGAEGGASVTEDLDISYRARLAGLRGVTLPEVAVQTELPASMAAFRAQQSRWVRGGAEVLRALGLRLWRGTIPARERVTMVGHLLRHARQPLLLSAALWLPAATLNWLHPPLSATVAWRALVALLLLAAGLYYGAALRRIGRAPWVAFALAPALVALSMGMSLALTVALARGLLASGRAEFVRTPKAGGYRARVDRVAWIEVAIGLVCLIASLVAMARGELVSGLALAALVASGFLWVGLGSLLDR